MQTGPIEYVRAVSAGDVLAALADGETSVLAGGQSLLDEAATVRRRVVDINGVAEFEALTEVDGVLRVSPLVRHRMFEGDTVGGPLGDLLRAVVSCMGHPPVRARGTMLGTLAYAHPAAEWPVVATILGGELDLCGPDGRRTVPAEQFFTGPFATVRRPEELLAEFRLPVLQAGTGTGYAEARPVAGDFATAATIAAVTVTGGTVTAAAVGLVNAGPRPVRARAAEAALLGSTFCDAAITAAAGAAAGIDARLERPGEHAHLKQPGERERPERLGERERRARRRMIQVLTRRALTRARSVTDDPKQTVGASPG